MADPSKIDPWPDLKRRLVSTICKFKKPGLKLRSLSRKVTKLSATAALGFWTIKAVFLPSYFSIKEDRWMASEGIASTQQWTWLLSSLKFWSHDLPASTICKSTPMGNRRLNPSSTSSSSLLPAPIYTVRADCDHKLPLIFINYASISEASIASLL